ncbi:MAG: helix-turn-helix transcriptional regulator [Proteobacteria bacterium]|nr:helix-turn-helix transcriptional regulator [Pseudomonadota bacterium]
MHIDRYLTTEEAAAYLKLKERKIYDLAANGAIPASKVTGRWLFPRAALDRWIEGGLSLPDGVPAAEPPAIVGGSHDLLLEWALRRSSPGLALLPEGSVTGLQRLVRNEVTAAAIHLHDAAGSEEANIAAVRAMPGLHDAVLIAFARREQGLVLVHGNPLGIASLSDAVMRRARFGLRQQGAGAQLLLESLLKRGALAFADLTTAVGDFPSGSDLALAIRNGDVDCGIATRAVAAVNGLAFVPLAAERLDLVMRRRSYFEPPAQALMTTLRLSAFAQQATAFGGYDVSEAGTVRLNR